VVRTSSQGARWPGWRATWCRWGAWTRGGSGSEAIGRGGGARGGSADMDDVGGLLQGPPWPNAGLKSRLPLAGGNRRIRAVATVALEARLCGER
jgi:hypothetical protein